MVRCSRFCFALAMAIVVFPPVAGAQVREFRISHQWEANVDARDRAARVFAAEVEKRVPGVKVTVHAKSSLGVKPVEQYEALLEGKFEMSVYPLFYGSKKVPEFAIGLLPGVPHNTDTARLLKGSDFADKLQELAEDKGIHVLTWWWLGGGIASSKKEIGAPETVVGLKVRGGDKTFDMMLAKAGGSPMFVSSNELAKAMADGRCELALTSYESFVSYKLYEHAKFVTFGGKGIWTSFQPLIMSKQAWQKLSDAEKEAFIEAAEISNVYFEKTQEEALKAAIDTFKKAGAKVRQLSFEEYAAWLHVARDTSWRTYQSISPAADELLISMLQSFIDSDSRVRAEGQKKVQ
ncbi:MAG: hypothetical protein F9K44_07525 [Hyphomicrobiaceae bacterium]|nr:MAG: hypothetical protein F9K44_07525 [Hyphomicrobiaceae bacterium]